MGNCLATPAVSVPTPAPSPGRASSSAAHSTTSTEASPHASSSTEAADVPKEQQADDRHDTLGMDSDPHRTASHEACLSSPGHFEASGMSHPLSWSAAASSIASAAQDLSDRTAEHSRHRRTTVGHGSPRVTAHQGDVVRASSCPPSDDPMVSGNPLAAPAAPAPSVNACCGSPALRPSPPPQSPMTSSPRYGRKEHTLCPRAIANDPCEAAVVGAPSEGAAPQGRYLSGPPSLGACPVPRPQPTTPPGVLHAAFFASLTGLSSGLGSVGSVDQPPPTQAGGDDTAAAPVHDDAHGAHARGTTFSVSGPLLSHPAPHGDPGHEQQQELAQALPSLPGPAAVSPEAKTISTRSGTRVEERPSATSCGGDTAQQISPAVMPPDLLPFAAARGILVPSPDLDGESGGGHHSLEEEAEEDSLDVLPKQLRRLHAVALEMEEQLNAGNPPAGTRNLTASTMSPWAPNPDLPSTLHLSVGIGGTGTLSQSGGQALSNPARAVHTAGRPPPLSLPQVGDAHWRSKSLTLPLTPRAQARVDAQAKLAVSIEELRARQQQLDDETKAEAARDVRLYSAHVGMALDAPAPTELPKLLSEPSPKKARRCPLSLSGASDSGPQHHAVSPAVSPAQTPDAFRLPPFAALPPCDTPEHPRPAPCLHTHAVFPGTPPVVSTPSNATAQAMSTSDAHRTTSSRFSFITVEQVVRNNRTAQRRRESQRKPGSDEQNNAGRMTSYEDLAREPALQDPQDQPSMMPHSPAGPHAAVSPHARIAAVRRRTVGHPPGPPCPVISPRTPLALPPQHPQARGFGSHLTEDLAGGIGLHRFPTIPLTPRSIDAVPEEDCDDDVALRCEAWAAGVVLEASDFGRFVD